MSGRGSGRGGRDLVRIDLLVFGFALFVAGYAVWNELDYAGFASGGERVEALIERVDKVGEGRGARHFLHYRYDFGGKTYRFDDRDDPDRLEELYTGTFNAFVDPDSPLLAGKRIGLMVDRSAPERHRPDRARLQLGWLPHVRTALALLFLGGMGTWLLRARRKEEVSAPTPASRSHVTSSVSSGVLELRVTLDVPWPEGGRASALEALRAKMPARGPLAQGMQSGTQAVTKVRVAVELSARQAITLDAVRVELASRSAEREVHTLARSQRLQAGQPQRFSVELPAPADLTEVRVIVVDTPSKTFTHTHVVGS